MSDTLENRIDRFDQLNGLEFIAWVTGSVTYDAKGDMKFTLTIPFEFRSNAQGIWDAMGFPVKIKVERWRGGMNID